MKTSLISVLLIISGCAAIATTPPTPQPTVEEQSTVYIALLELDCGQNRETGGVKYCVFQTSNQEDWELPLYTPYVNLSAEVRCTSDLKLAFSSQKSLVAGDKQSAGVVSSEYLKTSKKFICAVIFTRIDVL